MLVLTRKPKEKIVIGNKNKVTITILKVNGDKVSIGFEADEDTPIYRAELLKEIEEANTTGAIQENSLNVKDFAKNIKIKTNK